MMGAIGHSTTKPETFMLTAEQQENLPPEAKHALEQVDDLKYFLATAPANWQVDQIIRRYLLPTGEYVSCVLWRNLFHITGTDIVRALTYRFQAFGRPVQNVKKFEEGIFSDLRNLKPGSDASLEEPKSAFLDLLYKNNCIRTQKKQKVFYWFSVPHDRLFLDALERDLKRERMGTEATTMAVQEPALSFVFDATQSLYEQLTKSMQHNAASEVGASLAAQQAQNNLMAAAQYGGGMQAGYMSQGFPVQSGPSDGYLARSQSIQSAVPIDYRGQTETVPQMYQPSQHYDVPVMNPQPHHHVDPNQAPDVYSEFHGYSMVDQERSISYDSMPPVHEDTGSSNMAYEGQTLDEEVHHQPFEYESPQSFHRTLPVPFNIYEGSPTYKQRRRRQSIPNLSGEHKTHHRAHSDATPRSSIDDSHSFRSSSEDLAPYSTRHTCPRCPRTFRLRAQMLAHTHDHEDREYLLSPKMEKFEWHDGEDEVTPRQGDFRAPEIIW